MSVPEKAVQSGGVAERRGSEICYCGGQAPMHSCPGNAGPDYDRCVRALLEVQELIVELPTPAGWIRPVNEVSLRIGAGDSLGLVGESGSGKTMLSLALMGLLPEGARVKGRAALGSNGEPRELLSLDERGWRGVRGRKIAMIFQEPMTSLNPVMRVGAQIEEAIRAHEPALSAKEIQSRSIEALRRAAVPEPEARAGQFPHQLSGGLRPRAILILRVCCAHRRGSSGETCIRFQAPSLGWVRCHPAAPSGHDASWFARSAGKPCQRCGRSQDNTRRPAYWRGAVKCSSKREGASKMRRPFIHFISCCG